MNPTSLSLAVVGRGRMGQLVEEVARERGHRVALTVGSGDNARGAGLTEAALSGVDLAIEFTRPEAAVQNIERLLLAGVGVVSGTTGWPGSGLPKAGSPGPSSSGPGSSEAGGELRRLGELAEARGVALLVAPNFAVGALLFRRIVRRAAELVARDELFDLWIEEAHHAGKLDAPSGTALALAEEVLGQLPRKRRVRTELESGVRPPADELLVRSSRGGHEPGLHRVVIDGPDESLELVHRVRSRRVFAGGAVRAAEWLAARIEAGQRGLIDWGTLGEALDQD